MMISEPLKFLRTASASALAAVLLAATNPVFSQAGVYAYPTAGQDEQTQARDRFDCHSWAVTQSGFDPTTAAPLPPAQYAQQPVPPPPQYQNYPPPRQNQGSILGMGNGGMFQGSGMLGDAATGAALGAAGGAIAGDAGEGAAIGAIAGTLFGALSRGSQQQQQPRYNDYAYQQQVQQQQYQQQQQAAQDQAYMQRQEQQAGYRRAYGACMSARNYTVQ